MPATIELSAEQEAQLTGIAASRGERGIAAVVQEAINQYLARREERIRSALTQRGVLDEAEAAGLAQHLEEIRRSWR